MLVYQFSPKRSLKLGTMRSDTIFFRSEKKEKQEIVCSQHDLSWTSHRRGQSGLRREAEKGRGSSGGSRFWCRRNRRRLCGREMKGSRNSFRFGPWLGEHKWSSSSVGLDSLFRTLRLAMNSFCAAIRPWRTKVANWLILTLITLMNALCIL